MKLIELKCPNCEAHLEVNEDLEKVTCNYCGTTFKLEDEKETKEERIIKTKAKVDEKAKEADRKYYASDDYAKKLDIEAEANDKSIIGRVGKQIQKTRDYYSSDEYKKRLEIQHEETKKSMKLLLYYFIGLIIFIALILILVFSLDHSDKEDDMTCTINGTEYVILIKLNEEIKCASCSDEMLSELNTKYLDKDSVTITKKNIKAYFNNRGGSCIG